MSVRSPPGGGLHCWPPRAGPPDRGEREPVKAALARGGRATVWPSRIPVLLPCLLALLAGSGGDGSQAQSPGAEYDLVVLVVAEAGQAEFVALSYTRAIESAALKESIERLGEAAGCRVSGISIREVPVQRGARELASDADFAAPGLIDLRGGGLPVGPMIRSFADWNRMRLVFLVGDEFPFAGPGDAEVEGFAVRLLGRVAPYEYDVERRRGTPQAGGETPPPQPRQSPHAGPFAWAVGGLCGALGLLLGWFVSGRGREAASA